MGLIMLRHLRLERFRAMARTTAVVSGATLVAFHGCLLAAQAAEGRLEDPWLVFRWLVAGGLVAALAAIRRTDGSIWNRQGLAVWVLAALLHGPAVATEFGNSINSLALPETVATSILESLVSVSALAVTLWMLAGFLGLRDRHARLYVRVATAGSPSGLFGDGFSPHYSSRPPPPQN
jgi:hypothetical protein